MGDVTVIGLGLMGSALARTFAAHAHRTTVWNRYQAKSDALASAGALVAASPLAAVQASPVTVVCLSGYATAHGLFEDAADGALSGHTIVQLGTGSPQDTIEGQAFFRDRGAAYLDGAILCGPTAIGTDAAKLLLCGDVAAWHAHAPTLRCLAGDLRWVDENVRAAAALDLAWLTQRFGGFVSVAHALALCASEGVGADTFAETVAEGDHARRVADVVHSGDYDDPTATLSVWRAANDQILAHAAAMGISTEFPALVARVLTRAEAHGDGDKDIAAIFKALQDRSG